MSAGSHHCRRLESDAGQLLGVRGTNPTCTAKPAWLAQLIDVEGADAQILTCAETSGQNLKIVVANNRAYPVALELSTPPKSHHVDMGWSAGVADVSDRLVAAMDSSGKTVMLPPLGTVSLNYGRPANDTLVTG